MAKNKIDKAALRDSILNADGLSNEDKSQLLALLSEKKTYGLVWENHSEDAEELLKENIPVLKEDESKRLDDGGEDAPNHILIEGDNLHALTALTYTHEGKVDVIYIDPPYNTGNKDFVYNDSFVDSEDSYRHSKWLSFMEKRLKIAKKLLSDKGVIFISIDDNEQANLKLLCDEVFGERNYIDTFSWNKTETPANLSLKTKKAIEYLLCYEKDRNNIKYRGLTKNSTSNNGLMNQTNSVHELVFPANIIDTKLTDGIYSKGVYGTSSYSIELLDDAEVKNGYFVSTVKLKGKFKWSQDNLNKEISLGTKVSIKTRAFSPSYEKAEYEPEVPWNLINKSFSVDTNEIASAQLKEILGETPFSFPKPCSLIKYLINFINADTILDFFAGSGTTLHATMQLNAEDAGHRQCILVTNNENNICEDVTYERNKRVINGYTTPKGVEVAGLKNNNLRYYKTEFVPRDNSHQSRKTQAYAMTDLLCIKEGIYEEKSAFGSLSLDGKAAMVRFFAEGNRQMLLVYDSRVIPYIVSEIKSAEKPKNDIKIYIFADGSYPYTADFDDVLDRVQLVAMPYAMNRALKLVMPEAEDIELEVEPENEEQDA